MNDEPRARKEIVKIGELMYRKGMVAANDGNISCRLKDGNILITPSMACKGFLSANRILKVDPCGNVVKGSGKPSSEMKLHLAIYQKRRDVAAVVHAHPPKTTAFAVAGIPLDKVTLPEVVFLLGRIAFLKYATPSTDGLAESVGREITAADALIMENHGAVTVGDRLFDAYFKMETLEHFASISFYAKLLGNERALDEPEVAVLFRIRESVFGKKVRNGG